MIKKIALAFALMIASSTEVARANSINVSSFTNGLFTPTASQRYFEQGRQQFQQEEQNFNHNTELTEQQLLKLPKFKFNLSPKEREQKLLIQPKDLS